jgi:hypothetical protein
MADLEQVAGTMSIKVSQEDDLVFTWQVPFNASGYSWIMTAHECNGSNYTIPIAASVQTSVLTYVQATFYASVLSTFDITSTVPDRKHSYTLKYTDTDNLTRRFITGDLEVV